MVTVLVFLAVLAVLVLSHELGHFILARRSGMRVEEFGFGFPPRLFAVRRLVKHAAVAAAAEASGGKAARPGGKPMAGQVRWEVSWGRKEKPARVDETDWGRGTLYSFNLLPLGGFVRIKGEDGAARQEADSFSAQPVYRRIAVVVAGVVMNVFLGFILFTVSFRSGVAQPTAAGAAPGGEVVERRVVILQVRPDTPAAQVGLQAGDKIAQVDARVGFSVAELQQYIQEHAGAELAVTVERAGALRQYRATPVVNPDTGRPGLGIAIAEISTVRYPWGAAIREGAQATGNYLAQIFRSFGVLLSDIFQGQGVGSSVAGPVGVAVLTGEAARLGFGYLIQFTALLSLNLAVLNILPFPALDGGRLVFLVAEAVIRRRLPPRYERLINTAGFLFLLLLILAVTIKDLRVLF